MAERLVDDMTMEKWDPTEYQDTYREDLLKLIEQKAAGKLKAVPKTKAPREAEVIDFSALLERSLAAHRRGRGGEERAAEEAPRRRPPPEGKRPAAKARRKAAPRGANHRRAA